MIKKKHRPQPTFNLIFKSYLPSLMWAGLIFILSNQQVLPGFSISLADFLFKKLAHIFVYAVLYYLLFRAYHQTHAEQAIGASHYYWPLFFAFLYAISDELHQSMVAGRYATLRDIGYDSLGMLSVLLHQQKLL